MKKGKRKKKKENMKEKKGRRKKKKKKNVFFFLHFNDMSFSTSPFGNVVKQNWTISFHKIILTVQGNNCDPAGDSSVHLSTEEYLSWSSVMGHLLWQHN